MIFKKKIIGLNILHIFLFTAISVYFLSKNYSFDAIGYSLSIQNADYDEIFHPYHLLYTYLLLIFYNSLNLITVIPAHIAGQCFSIIFSVLSLTALAIFFYKFFFDKRIAFFAVQFFSLTYWFWYYSIDVELHIPNIFGIICALWLMFEYNLSKKNSFNFMLALLCSFMILMHQLNLILWGISFIFAIACSTDRKRVLIVWTVCVFFAALLPYIILPYYFFDFKSPSEFWVWITRYQTKGYWAGITQHYFNDTIRGISGAIFGGGKIKQVLTFFLLLSTIFFYCSKAITKKITLMEYYIISLFFGYSIIIIYWHPANVENWWSILFFIILLFKFFENLICMNKRLQMPVKISILILLIYIYYAVFFGYIKKYSALSFNKPLAFIHNLQKKYSEKNILFICAGEGDYARFTVYLKYFSKLEFISLAAELDKYNGNIDKTLNSIEISLRTKSKTILLADDVFNIEAAGELGRMHKIPELPDILKNYFNNENNSRFNIFKCPLN